MSTMTTTTEKVTPVTSIVNAAAASKSGNAAIKEGATFSVLMTNGGTGPTSPCVCTVYLSHEDTAPADGAAGWKLYTQLTGSTAASFAYSRTLSFERGRHVRFVFAGNNQSVTVEAVGTVDTGFVSV